RHVPDEIRAVPSVPRTLSGKVLEVPVKRILSGEPAHRALSRDSLADPDALRPFEELAEEVRSEAGSLPAQRAPEQCLEPAVRLGECLGERGAGLDAHRLVTPREAATGLLGDVPER